MSLKIDRVELEIVIKNDETRTQMRQLEEGIRKVRKELSNMKPEDRENSKQMAQLRSMQAEYDKLFDKIGLGNLSIKELQRRQAELNLVIKQLPGSSPLLTKYQNQLKEVTGRLNELTGKAQATGLSLSKMANGINKYFGLITVGIAGITGASMAFRKMAEDFAHMEDVESDVMKTTNLTKEEVVALNEEFKKMDTRTSRESLNQLARDAGKLGIEGSKNILDFVEAGNQINVALGEDLGENAIKNIGKMVGVFAKSTKELQGIGLKEQMLAVGSAINTLGASSSADEGYLVDFAGRLGGVAKQANISMDAILGFGSALDQDMQQTEMAATAFQNFILKLMGDPAKFAKLAGLEVKGFTKLLGTDANAAIKQVLRAMNEKGGFQALIPLFQDMGLDGSRAVGVLSSMAGSIDKIDEAQRIANKSLAEGTSATKEYNIKNTNTAAQLDKAKKGFNETALALGSSLNPVLLKSTHLITYITKGLVVLIPYLPTIGRWMLLLTGYFIAYNGQQLLNNILMKEGLGLKIKNIGLKVKDAIVLEGLILKEAIHAALIGKTTLATKAAAVAQALWNNAIKANPLGFILGLLTTLAASIWLVATLTKKATALQESQLNIQKKVDEQYGSQAAKIDQLVSTLNNEKIALERRKKALNDLKAIIPGYHADLTTEGQLINDNTDAIKDYLVELEKEVRFQASKEELEELYRKKRKAQEAKKAADNALIAAKNAPKPPVVAGREGKSMETSGAISYVTLTKSAADAAKILNDVQVGIVALETEINNTKFSPINISTTIVIGSTKLDENGNTLKWDGKKWILISKTGGGSGQEDKVDVQRKKISDEMTTLETANLEKIKAIQERYKNGEIKTEYDYNQELLKQQDDFDKLKIAKIQELNKSITDPSLKKDLLNQEAEINKKNLDRQIEQNEKIKKIILEADPRKAELQDFENRLRDTGLFGLKKESMTAEQLEAYEALEKQHNEKMRKLSSKEANLALDKLATDQAKAEALLAERRGKEKMSDQQFKDEQLKLELEFLRKKLAIQGMSAEQIETITKQIQDKQNDIVLSGADNREAILQKYGIETLKDQNEAELALIQYYEDQKVITHAEALEIKKKLSDEHFRKQLDQVSEYFDAAASIANQASNIVNGLQDAELTTVESKYDGMIRAAKKNGQDTTQLEAEKEEEQAKIRAKYADANFVITVAQIVAQTAKAAIDSYTSMAAIPVVGPVLGAAAATAAVIYGGVQIKQAKSARDAAKAGYRMGGFTDDDPDDDKEVGVVHANEFVAKADGVRNPHVRKFLDVFDVAQKRGTIHLLNTSQILEQTKLTAGSRRSGGYGSDGIPVLGIDSGSGNSSEMLALLRRNVEMHDRLMTRLNYPLHAKAVISGDDGVARQLERYNGYIRNASRE